MPLTSTILFDLPQREIASLIVDRITRSTSTSIVTGFATPGGLAAIAEPIKLQPMRLNTLIVGAATYPAFGALDDLLAAGVPSNRLFFHLGHTRGTGGKRNPFARYHPMLHSKVYYMELPGAQACAFIGSHNLTLFALEGLNGEAATMIEGPFGSPEFDKVRSHIKVAQSQAVQYSPGMKEAYAWWTREFIDGLKAEVQIPPDWGTVRTILLFASAAPKDRPKTGDHLYFEIPAGIEQIESLKTETHLFLFDKLPADPWKALTAALNADATYTCRTLGVENRQGNKEVVANWRIDETPTPVLRTVPGGTFRPLTQIGKQQVRAEVQSSSVDDYEYRFERDRAVWDPEFAAEGQLEEPPQASTKVAQYTAHGRREAVRGWKLVKGLVRREGSARERDQAALQLVSPDSGSFILVSLKRRRRATIHQDETDQ